MGLLVAGCKPRGPADAPHLADRSASAASLTLKGPDRAIDISVPIELDAIVYTTCDASMSVGRRSSLVHFARSDLAQEGSDASIPSRKAAGASWHVRETTDPKLGFRFFGALSEGIDPPIWIGAKANDASALMKIVETVAYPGSSQRASSTLRTHRVGQHAVDLGRSAPFKMITLRNSEAGFAAAAYFTARSQWSFDEAKFEKELAGRTLRYAKGSSPLHDDESGGRDNPLHRSFYGYVDVAGGILFIRTVGDPFTEAYYLRFAQDVIEAANLHPRAACRVVQ